MATMTSGVTTRTSAESFAALNGSGAATVTENEAGSADRFLKLLVAQMQNQDPLNPMDNAQVTSQMAQINTVDGISKLNQTVQGLNTQFSQLQALQAASLIGREVSVPGDRLALEGSGAAATGSGSFELAGPADNVRLEILNASGRVLSTQELGAAKAGSHAFEWKAGSVAVEAGMRFRVVATRGTAAVSATTYSTDRVLAVSTSGDKLQLELEGAGITDYSTVKAVMGS